MFMALRRWNCVSLSLWHTFRPLKLLRMLDDT